MNLLLHVLRSATSKIFRLISIAAIVGLTMGIYAGTYSAIDGLLDFVDRYYTASNMADLEIRIGTEDDVNLPDFHQVDGVSIIEKRLIMSGVATLSGTPVSTLLIGRPDVADSSVNAIRTLVGDMNDIEDDRILLDRNCATHFNLSLNSTIPVTIGHDEFSLTVGAIGESPEFLIAPANPAAFLPTDGSLCVIFMESGWLQDRLGFTAINALLFRYQNGIDQEKIRTALINKVSEHAQLEQAIRRNENFSYLFLDLDLDTFRSFLPTIVFVFSMSSFFVIIFLGFQWIAADRSQIGMMMALGFPVYKIVAAYSLIGLLIIIGATLISWPLSYISLYGFGLNFASAISMSEPDIYLISEYFVFSIIGALILVTLALFLPLASIFRMSPIEAVRENSSTMESPLQIGFNNLFKSLPVWVRFGSRNTTRRPLITVATILAIAACLGVTISFSISLTSMERTAINSFKDDDWSATVDLARYAWIDQLEEFYTISPEHNWSGFLRGYGFIKGPEGETNVFITGVDVGSGVKKLKLIEGDMPKSDEVVIEAKLARELMVKTGDKINIQADGRTTQTIVSGVHSGSFPGEIWADISLAQSLFDREEQVSGLFYTGPIEQLDTHQLMMLNDVIGVFTQQEAIDAVLSMSSEIWVILNISTWFSIFAVILFVFSNLSFLILSRESEYSMMRVLGFGQKTVSATIIVEVFFIGILAIMLAPAVGYYVGDILNDKLTDAWFKVDTLPSVWDFINILGPAILFVPLGALPAIYKLSNVPIAEAVRIRRIQ